MPCTPSSLSSSCTRFSIVVLFAGATGILSWIVLFHPQIRDYLYSCHSYSSLPDATSAASVSAPQVLSSNCSDGMAARNPSVVVVFGPPGAGKGTQALHISSKVSKRSSVGTEVSQYMNVGDMVPDEIILKIISSLLTTESAKKGFLFDGFPRTLDQAIRFEEILALHQMTLEAIIYLEISDEEIMKRLSARRVCKTCSGIHQLDGNPNGMCPRCNGDLLQREDDKEDVIIRRISNFHRSTMPVLHHFEEKNIVARVNGTGSTMEVFERIVHAIGLTCD